MERQFYFFGPAGCKNGADCLFCNEYHPRRGRKGAKKNAPSKKAPSKKTPMEIDELDELLSLVYGSRSKLPGWKKESPKELNVRNALLASGGDLQGAMEHLRSRAP